MRLDWRDVPVGTTTISTSLTGAEAAELERLADGRHVLEVGSANGYSAVQMAKGAVSILAVDPHTHVDGSLEEMRANLVRHDPDRRVSMLLAHSQHALPALQQLGARFGLIFIDGDHSKGAVQRDVCLAMGLLAPDGVLACHDHGEVTCPGVADAIEALGPLTDGGRLVDTLWIWEKR